LIFDGVNWTIARDWNSVTIFVWRPTTRAAYRIGIWARDATTTGTWHREFVRAAQDKKSRHR
jgi:hypothetical protein